VQKVTAVPIKFSESNTIRLSWQTPSTLNGHDPTTLSYQVTYCQLNFLETCKTLSKNKETHVILAPLKRNTFYQYKIVVFDVKGRGGPFPHEHFFKTARQSKSYYYIL